MNKNSTIFIVGHDGIIEKGLLGYFRAQGFNSVFSSSEMLLNTTIQPVVYEFFAKNKPDIVILGSTRAGGIKANQEFPADFIYHNSATQNNVIYAAWKFGVKKLLYLGSSCVYPKQSAQPIKPEYLLGGPLEKTSEPYAVAKLCGIKLCQAFRAQYGLNAIVAVPATVYGPQADLDLEKAHVLGALLTKIVKANDRQERHVVVWGSGNPRREFIYIDDLITACVHLLMKYNGEEVVHIGTGEDITIRDLAEMLAEIVDYKGEMVYDKTKPDGAMQKLLDNTYIKELGWQPKYSLRDGLEKTYEWYLSTID